MTEYEKNIINQGLLSRGSRKCVLNNDIRVITIHNDNYLCESTFQFDILRAQGIKSFNFKLTKPRKEFGEQSIFQSNDDTDTPVVKVTPYDLHVDKEFTIGNFKSQTGEFFLTFVIILFVFTLGVGWF